VNPLLFKRTVRDSGESLLTINDDILDFSKIEAGKLDVEVQPFDLRECVGSAVELVRHRATEKQLTLGAEGRAKLFQSFSQADSSTTRKYGGTGLGLVIGKRLAEIMGGGMSAESAGAGKGCTFRFHIRTESLAAQAAPVRPTTETTLDPQMAQRHPLRILLAEDNLVNQKLALRLLNQMGYTADVVGNGALAVERIEQQRHDVVLMDVQMPEMDGLEASRRVTARHAPHERPRIVAMTANAMQGDREECLAAGMDDYVTKPIRVDALVQALLAVRGGA
jgi:CheY-like chemotaxis protein